MVTHRPRMGTRGITMGLAGVLAALVVTVGPATAADLTDTAVGALAMPATTGHGNTAVGFGALFSDTDGSYNTAVGSHTLSLNTSGVRNTAVGVNALYSNHADFNTAVGVNALVFNDTGVDNTAVGESALSTNDDGAENTAVGVGALAHNTTGNQNTAVGKSALFQHIGGVGNTAVGNGALATATTGSRNIAIGEDAGSAISTGSDNIAIGAVGTGSDGTVANKGVIRIGTAGTHAFTIIAGIAGATVANSAAVLIDTNSGQLGTVVSTARLKQDIEPMGAATRGLMALRPVTFRYREDPTGERQYGLIAEEVAGVYPELVTRDASGAVYTVRYHQLPAMLLNEWQQQVEVLERQGRELAALQAENAALRVHLAEALTALRGQLAELKIRLALPGDIEPRQARMASQ